MGNNQGVIALRHGLVRIVTALIKELGDKDGVNWAQVGRDAEELQVLAQGASHVHARYNHIVEKLKEG